MNSQDALSLMVHDSAGKDVSVWVRQVTDLPVQPGTGIYSPSMNNLIAASSNDKICRE